MARPYVRNDVNSWLRRGWAVQAAAAKTMLLTAGEAIANRVREGYSGIMRQGVDTGGWREGHAPVFTGQMAGGTRVDNSRLQFFAITILLAKEYAAYVEFGTINMEPRPFLREAMRIEAPWANRQVRAS